MRSFVWLLFAGRRIPVYDHAIFVTYSLSFMMLWFVVLSLGGALVRLVFLLIAAGFVLVIFVGLLLALGLVG